MLITRVFITSGVKNVLKTLGTVFTRPLLYSCDLLGRVRMHWLHVSNRKWYLVLASVRRLTSGLGVVAGWILSGGMDDASATCHVTVSCDEAPN